MIVERLGTVEAAAFHDQRVSWLALQAARNALPSRRSPSVIRKDSAARASCGGGESSLPLNRRLLVLGVTVSGSTGQDSALKRARLARNLTLEQAAAQLNRTTGGSTDASALSAWESGRKRTGIGNRRALSHFYRERPEVLFAHQDGRDSASMLEAMGTDVVVRVLTRYTDLVEAMVQVVSEARGFLVVTGSRSREKAYLTSIETAVAQQPDLVHYRVLYGPPRHLALSEHLVRLLELRDPAERRNGVKSLHLGIVEPLAAMERHFVASESAAVVPLPSFHGAEGFDCGVLMGREAALGLVQHGREACASARPVETVEAVRALLIWHGGTSGQGEA